MLFGFEILTRCSLVVRPNDMGDIAVECRVQFSALSSLVSCSNVDVQWCSLVVRPNDVVRWCFLVMHPNDVGDCCSRVPAVCPQ